MKACLVFAAFLLVYQGCSSRAVSEEESVVSVYTTLPTTTTGAGAGAPRDVYRQIADNIAERITQPIYRFFGIGNQTSEEKTTKRPFEHIEIVPTELELPKTDKNESNLTATSPNITTTDSNEIPDRDVEELSLDAIQKRDKKPEKFVLYSSYLPVKENLELNDNNTDSNDNEIETSNNTKETNDNKVGTNISNIDTDDNSLELDDVDSFDDNGDAKATGREGPFVYILELVGSIIQLLWGGFLALFQPTTTTS